MCNRKVAEEDVVKKEDTGCVGMLQRNSGVIVGNVWVVSKQ